MISDVGSGASKERNTYFGFGTDNDLEHSPGYLIVKQSSFPVIEPHPGGADFDPDFASSREGLQACVRVQRHFVRPRSSTSRA